MFTSSLSQDLQDIFTRALKLEISLSLCEIETDKHLSGRECLAKTLFANEGFTSISHSLKIAVAVSTPKTEKLCGIGIDIEEPRNLDVRASKMFLTRDEISKLQDTSSENLIKLWTIKEALFKSAPENNGMFLRDFEIASIQEDSFGTAICNKRPELTYNYFCTSIENLTISVAKCLHSEGDQENAQN